MLRHESMNGKIEKKNSVGRRYYCYDISANYNFLEYIFNIER